MTKGQGAPTQVVDILHAAVFASIATVLLSVGVVELGVDGRPPTGDAEHYLAMASGQTEAPAPFAFRVAVPRLAGLISHRPPDGFRLLTRGAVWLGLVLVWLLGRRMNLNSTSLGGGLSMVVFTQGFAYQFHNPFLTDAVSSAVSSALLVAWWLESGVTFVALITLAVCVRETTLLITPVWLLRGPRLLGPLSGAIGIGALLLIHDVVETSSATGLASAFLQTMTQKGPLRVLGDALGAWHVLYAVGLVGAWRLRSRQPVLLPLLALTLLMSSVLCLVAINTNRMMTFAWPVVALALAAAVEGARNHSERIALALLPLIQATLLTTIVPFSVKGPPATKAITIVALVIWLVLWARAAFWSPVEPPPSVKSESVV